MTPPPEPAGGTGRRVLALHLAVPAFLFAIQFHLPEYYYLGMPRMMILALYAMGYNLLFGYTGLLSLGHAMFFAAGAYGAGLTAFHLGWSPPAAFLAGTGAGILAATVTGTVILGTRGVAFMIVTLMFSQVAWLASLHFSEWTRGDEGLSLPAAVRRFHMPLLGDIDLASPVIRYNVALLLLTLTLVLLLFLVQSRPGRILVAIRENEQRTLMLGYDCQSFRLAAIVLSGTLAAIAGAAHVLLFAYVGSGFASVSWSIDPLLHTLLGGAGVLLGPLAGAGIMFFVTDFFSSHTRAWPLVTGIMLILLVSGFPRGILGTIRERWCPWLP